MASLYHRLLPITSLTASQVQTRDEVLDIGAYRVLEIQVRVISAGTAGNLKLQHAAVNEPDAFKDLSGASFALTPASNQVMSISNFLRYLRWVTDNGVAGGPVALIDIVAKE